MKASERKKEGEREAESKGVGRSERTNEQVGRRRSCPTQGIVSCSYTRG